MRPDTDLLLSPYDHGPAWPSAQMVAACSTNPEHCPPAAACDCGLYSERTFEDARERARRHRRVVRFNLAVAGLSRPPQSLPAYVIGGVEMTGAAPFVPPAGSIRIGDDELRAASARITSLYVLAGASDPLLGERLAERYGVPVSVDEPPYSERDWAEKLLPEHRYLQVGLVAPLAVSES